MLCDDTPRLAIPWDWNFLFPFSSNAAVSLRPSCPCLCGLRMSLSRSIRLPQCPAIAFAAATPIEPHLLFWADPASANRRAAQSFWPHGWCECFMSNVMMLSREPGLGGDTSFIPNSHGCLRPALNGAFLCRKGRIDLQTQLGRSVVRGRDGKSNRLQWSSDVFVCNYACAPVMTRQKESYIHSLEQSMWW